MSDNNEEKKASPEGSTRVHHVTFSSMRLKATIKWKNGNTSEGIKGEYTDTYGKRDLLLHCNKFIGNGLKVPENVALLKGCTAIAEAIKVEKSKIDEDDWPDIAVEATIYSTMGNAAYWDHTNIVLGHVGTSGILKPGESHAGQVGGGTHYDPAGAIQGQKTGLAFSLAISRANGEKPVTKEDCIQAAKDIDSWYLDVKQVFSSVAETPPAPSTPSEPSAEEDDLISADIPF